MQNMQKYVFVAYKGFWKLSSVENKFVWCIYTWAKNIDLNMSDFSKPKKWHKNKNRQVSFFVEYMLCLQIF